MENIATLLHDFVKIPPNDIPSFTKYVRFDFVRECAYKGAGKVGMGGHLILWNACELETINDEYYTLEFLTNAFLIGSDGGGNAYGVNVEGDYFTVPFISMCDEEVSIIGKSFDGFVDYVANLTYE